MSKSCFRWARLFGDFIITLFQVALLYCLFLIVLDMDFEYLDLRALVPFILALAAVICIVHSVLCLNNWFFWKFAFLLPDDIYYYILAENKCVSDQDLRITLYAKNKFILSRPELKNPKDPDKNSIYYKITTFYYCGARKAAGMMCDFANKYACTLDKKEIEIKEKETKEKSISHSEDKLTFNIKKSSNREAERIILWLRKTGNNVLTIDNKENFNVFESKFGDDSCSGLSKCSLLVSKNVILLLGRSLLLAFLFFLILLQNPPLMIAVEPLQFQENWTSGQEKVLMISAKNIGCNLLDAYIWTNSSNNGLITATWTSNSITKKNVFLSNDVDFIRLKVDEKCPAGEYRGSIKITGYANRTIIPDLPYLGLLDPPFIETPITVPTYTKKLAEVPFFFKIIPKLNAMPLEQQKT
jgi:hypothetical protein